MTGTAERAPAMRRVDLCLQIGRCLARPVYARSRFQFDRGQQAIQLFRLGMKHTQLGQRTAGIGQRLRRMGLRLPLDKRRCRPAQGELPIRTNGDLPGQCTTAHGRDCADNSVIIGAGGMNIVTAHDPGRQLRRGIRIESVKSKPTRLGRRRGLRIRRYDFEIGCRAKFQQAIVRTHAAMRTPIGQGYAQRLFNCFDAHIKLWCGYDNMIKM